MSSNPIIILYVKQCIVCVEFFNDYMKFWTSWIEVHTCNSQLLQQPQQLTYISLENLDMLIVTENHLQVKNIWISYTFWLISPYFCCCNFQLTSIEQELLSLLRLDHPNIVHYLAIKHTQGKEATSVEVRDTKSSWCEVNVSVIEGQDNGNINNLHFCLAWTEFSKRLCDHSFCT